jgi:peptidoglycan LD-endopeptidase LytH
VGLCVLTLYRGGLMFAAWPYRKRPSELTVPVEGLRREGIRSQWQALRSGGRRHQGVDLFSARGTPVISATRGRVWKVGTDRLGGRVVTVLGEGAAFYYYAHLDDWAQGLTAGAPIEAGQKLGTVGNTGNAATTPPHLHFGVYRIGWLAVSAVDPAPLLNSR